MTEKEGTFSGPRGLSIYYRYWIPNEQPKALVLLVHGAGEHCARYQQFAEFMVSNGYVVAALDHPGHGKSDGTPGFCRVLRRLSRGACLVARAGD